MKSRILLFLAIIVILQACSTVSINTDWDREAKFDSYKTFDILPRDEANRAIINDLDWQRITKAITNEMTARGYSFQDGDADLDVGVHIVLENKTDVNAYTDYYGSYGYGGYGYGYGAYGTTTTVTETNYTQGTLILDVLDANQKALIWQGIAVATVKPGNKNRESRINTIFAKMFASYPLKKSK